MTCDIIIIISIYYQWGTAHTTHIYPKNTLYTHNPFTLKKIQYLFMLNATWMVENTNYFFTKLTYSHVHMLVIIIEIRNVSPWNFNTEQFSTISKVWQSSISCNASMLHDTESSVITKKDNALLISTNNAELRLQQMEGT